MTGKDDTELISEILACCRIADEELKICRRLNASSGKILYQLSNSKDIIWLKIFPEKRKFRQELAALQFTGRHFLHGTPQLLGYTIDRPATALLFSHCSGEHFSLTANSNTSRGIFHHAGIFLHRLHQLPITSTDDISPCEALRLRIRALEKQSRKLNLLKKYPDFNDRLNSIMPVLNENSTLLTRSFCHRDFSPRNWLYDQTTQNFSVIDFEHARTDIALLDLVKLNAHYFPAHPEYKTAFYTGYHNSAQNKPAESPAELQKKPDGNTRQYPDCSSAEFTRTLNALTLFYSLQTLAWAIRYNDAEFLALAHAALNHTIK